VAAGETPRALELLAFARRNIGPLDERLAASAAEISGVFAASGTVEDALRVREAVATYPGGAHVPHVKRAMRTLLSADRTLEALELFAQMRAHLPEGDASLSEQAIIVFETVSEDAEERARHFNAVLAVEDEMAAAPEARARWLLELGDIACFLHGSLVDSAERYYRSAADTATASAPIALARLGVLSDFLGKRDAATQLWSDLASRAGAPAGLALAARVVLDESQPEELTRWQAEHPAEMSAAELALYLGLRGFHSDSGRGYEASNEYLRRARELISGRKWPYHARRWLLPY
jgi:hypothetical protein